MPAESKIFGLGLPKTGTTSLARAVEMLGYSVYSGHWQEPFTAFFCGLYINHNYERIIEVLDLFDGGFDFPVGGTQLYQKLEAAFDRPRYILTYRAPEDWLASLNRMIKTSEEDIDVALRDGLRNRRIVAYYLIKEICSGRSGAEMRRQLLDYHQRYYDEVEAFARSRSERVLFFSDPSAYNWEDICSFLDKEIPNQEMPHLNKGQ